MQIYSLNRVTLIGRAGSNPDYRTTVNGNTLARFSLATSRGWRDKAGDWKEETQWHRIIAWGPDADRIDKHLTKGNLIYIEGRLQTREWTDRQGAKRETTEVVTERIAFVAGTKRRPESADSAPIHPSEPDITSQPATEFEDDLPF